ncbi:hypothetical protein OG723_38540 [Streptomyces sp. NBC_01278]|uniref:hypothetical protein n=1 Tax=Streptomyces sp. NBC_01278 TaxID=2903809 RepID=UPI002E322896|nr:hypothetical protein [Streptomyces sp. NBC_01278]
MVCPSPCTPPAGISAHQAAANRTFAAYEEALDGHLDTLLGQRTGARPIPKPNAGWSATPGNCRSTRSTRTATPWPVRYGTCYRSSRPYRYRYGLLDSPAPVDGTPPIGQFILQPPLREISVLALAAGTPDLESWPRALAEHMAAVA